MALHESFLSHAGGRWLKLGLLLIAASIAAYAWHDPAAGPNGGTWLGYTLGTIGALLILWLALLGARKRSYRSNLGTVKGWTSAHVWLGLSLLIIATLHSGFQFGWNIHTFAWALMVLGPGGSGDQGEAHQGPGPDALAKLPLDSSIYIYIYIYMATGFLRARVLGLRSWGNGGVIILILKVI